MTRFAPTHRSSRLRTTLRVIAVFAGISACALPRLVHGQTESDSASIYSSPSGAVLGQSDRVIDDSRKGFGAQLTTGHIAGEGPGRFESISYVGLQPYMLFDQGLFFGDARLTRSNKGHLAWSFGSGYRQYVSQWDAIIGGNAYLDRDQLAGVNFEQWSAGAEVLTSKFDWHGNIYKTFGSVFKQTGLVLIPDSTRFADYRILFDQARLFARALSGFDTEVGVPLPGRFLKKHQAKGFVGAYWFEGQVIDDVRGWKLRLQGDVLPWLKTSVQLTEDQTYDTNVMFNVEVALGGMTGPKDYPKSTFERITQSVLRNRNIVVANLARIERDIVATDPDTGGPLFLYHVDSNNPVGHPGGDGTVENPFTSIQLAQTPSIGPTDPPPAAELIFVHTGSTFNDVGALSTVALAEDQRILGEGTLPQLPGSPRIEHRVIVGNDLLRGADGTSSLILPTSPAWDAFTPSPGVPTPPRPVLFGSSNPIASVTMANNSEFSGFQIESPVNSGIVATDLMDTATMSFNLINNIPATAGVPQAGSGILISGGTGTFLMLDTIINQTDSSGAALAVVPTAPAPGTAAPLPQPVGALATFTPTVTFSSSQLLVASGQINTSGTGALGGTLPGPSVLVQETTGGRVNMRLSQITETGTVNAASVPTNGGGGVMLNGVQGNVTIGDAMLFGPNSGVSISGGSGTITFARNFLGSMTIDGVSATPSIAINGANAVPNFGPFTGSAEFDQIDILNRGHTAISMLSLGDITTDPQDLARVTFTEPVNIGADVAVSGNDAVQFRNSLANVRFNENLTVDAGGSLRGITIVGNEPNSNFTVAPISFTDTATTTVNNASGESIYIGQEEVDQVGLGTTTTDSAAIRFSGVSIDNRGRLPTVIALPNVLSGFVPGIFVFNKSEGSVDFDNVTSVDNQLFGIGSAIDITGNVAPVTFENAIVSNGNGFLFAPAVPIEAGQRQYGAGINIFNNTGLVRFDNINVVTGGIAPPAAPLPTPVVPAGGALGGIGLYAESASNLVIQGGSITSTMAPAVEINSGTAPPARGAAGRTTIAILLDDVTSTASPRNGIEILNVDGSFAVNPGPSAVQPVGGTISLAAGAPLVFNRNGRRRWGAGAYLDDVNGSSQFIAQLFTQNRFGIHALDSNQVVVQAAQLDTHLENGMLMRNVTRVNVTDTAFQGNGTGLFGDPFQEDFLYEVDQLPLDDNDADYLVFIDNSTFTTNFTNIVARTIGSIDDVSLGFEVEDSIITNAGVGGFLTTATFDSADGISIVWDGDIDALIERNTININGINQTGIFFNTTSRDDTDQATLNVLDNNINNLGTAFILLGDQYGVDVLTAGPAGINIDNNTIIFNNGRNTGLRFNTAADSNISVTNNNIQELFDLGTGILFTSVTAPSNIQVDSNTILLQDADVSVPGIIIVIDGLEERGIIFSSVSGGIVNLSGSNNIVQVLNFGGDIDQFFFFPDPALANGQIEVNGVLVP